MSVYPRKYATVTALGIPLRPVDWDAMVDRVNGFTPTGNFISPHQFVISKATIDAVDYYFANNAFQTIYGGDGHAGSVDGTNAVDVIQAAGTAAAGGAIFLREGTYVCDDEILLPNTSIEGVYGKTNLSLDDNVNKTLLTIGETDVSHSYLYARNLRLLGNGAKQSGTSYGLKVMGIYEPQIFNVTGQGWLSGALLIDGTATHPTILTWVDKCLFEYNYGNGVTVQNSAWDTMLTNNNVGGNLGTAFEFGVTTDGLKISNNSIWLNNKGIELTGILKFKIDGNEFDSNGVADIEITNSHHGNISNNQFYGCSAAVDGATPSIILRTNSALTPDIDTQNIMVNNNIWFKEPHTADDIYGDPQSVGDHKASYCVAEINTVGGDNTNFIWYANNDFYEYTTAPCLIVGDGSRRMNCYPENQNLGKDQGIAESVSSVVQELWKHEPDTNYVVTVIPHWNTTYWITDKAVDDFTINFGTAPGISGSSYDFYVSAMP